MTAEIDFQLYLQSISQHYAQWWQLYTLTDAETKAKRSQQPESQKSPFAFGLMVRSVQKDRDAGLDGSRGGDLREREKVERFPVMGGIRKFVKEHRQVLLVGRPGSGKSTTLARLLLEEARGCLPSEGNASDQPSDPLLGGAGVVPEPSRRGGLVKSVTAPPSPPYGHPSQEGITGVNVDSVKHTLDKIPVLVELRFWQNSIADLIRDFFKRHQLLLDRTEIENLLFHQRFLLLIDGLNELPSEAARLDVIKFRQDHPQVSMIFTTRDLSLGGDFGLEHKLEMQPLTEVQMKDFVRSYLPEQAEAMLRQMKERLREFGQTPLLLWMLCDLFRQTKQIPNNLGEVFRAFIQGYERNLKADMPIQSNKQWWPELLQELAFAMMHSQSIGVNGVRPFPDIEFRTAIPRTEVRQIFAAFLQNKASSAEGAAQEYLDDLFRHHLIQFNGEQVEFQHQLIQEYYAAEYLLRHWGQFSELEFKRNYLNYLKWTEAIGLMVGLIDNEEIVLQLIESALNIDLMLGAQLAGRVRSELQPTTVGKVNELETPKWFKVKLLAEMRANDAIPGLLKAFEDEDPRVRRSAADSLGQIGSEQAIPGLLKALNDTNSYVRGSAVDALGKIDSEQVIPGLLKALKDEDSYVRTIAARALGGVGSGQVIPALLKALKDKVPYVRFGAVHGLGNLDSEERIPGLLKALEDEDSKVRRLAAKMLWNIDSEQVVLGLLKILEHENSRVRMDATDLLGSLCSEQTIPALLKAVKDEDSNVRKHAVDGLRKLGSEKAISGLLEILENADFDSCDSAARALGRLGSEQAIPGLLKALEHKKSYVRRSATYALGDLRLEQTIPSLLKALEDKDSGVRWMALLGLGNLDSEKVIPGLLKALEDEDLRVRRLAADRLEDIKKASVVCILPRLANLIPTSSGEVAFDTMVTIQSNCKFYNYDLTQTTQSMKLFFSYSHKDELLRDELAKHLIQLKRDKIITTWHDRDITAGTDWAEAIDENLNTANIILLLVSSDFLASDYCYDIEMQRAIERHNNQEARVIPIILRPCDWHSAPFGKLQALPISPGAGATPVTEWDNQDKAFLAIAQGIRKAVTELQQH